MSTLSNQLEMKFVIPNNVLHCYTQPHRKYHDIEHIKYMLRKLPIITNNFEDVSHTELVAIVWAIFYHDIVYDLSVPVGANEEASAAQFLKDHKHYPQAGSVAEAIRNTTTHILSSNSLVSKYLIDLDLWALSDDVAYTRNSLLIQEENNLTDEEWAMGRGKWLADFLTRDQIYYTPIGMTREDEARRILGAELNSLS